MRVLIEASELYRNQTGIGRFGRGLVAHLPPDIQPSFSPPDYQNRQHPVEERTLTRRLRHFGEHLWLTQTAVSDQARRVRPDVVHTLNFFAPLLLRRTPIVCTIFDLAYFDLPAQTDAFWGRYGRALMPVFARHAAAIITTSETSRGKIIARFGLAPEKVYCVSSGIDAQFRPLNSSSDAAQLTELRARYHLPETFILYVGAWHASKNLPTLIRAMAQLGDVPLVLTGAPYTAEQHHLLDLASELRVTTLPLGHVPDADLPGLYTLARMVVMPSLYEGFGLPMVEAMACGTPVVASDLPVLREVAGTAALFFETLSPESLAESLTRLLGDSALHTQMQAAALERSTHFNWRTTADTVAAIWRAVAERGP